MLTQVSMKRTLALTAVAIATAAAMIASTDPSVARDRNQERTQAPEAKLDGRAVVAVVSIKDQRISLYDAKGNALRARISSGQSGYETPVGVFSVLQKEVEHHSNLYDDASMPFMQRLTWSGVAFHAGALPGYPASHGCVRLPYEFAQRIFSQTKLGMRVVLSRDDIAPVAIANPLLLKPAPLKSAPIVQTPVATPAAYDPAEADDESVTLLRPDVRNWPARQSLLDALQAAVKVKAEEAKAAVARWETTKVELNKFGTEVALVSKRERAAEIKRKAEARLAKADKVLAEAKTPRAQSRAQKEKTEATTSLAAADTKLAEATKAAEQADKVVGRIKADIAAAETAKTAAVAAAAEAKRKTLPISVFVSAKSQKLYVRQGNEPVFDAPVTVTNTGDPIGTHVFTALGYTADENDVQWNVVTISQRSAGEFGDYDEEDWGRRRKQSKTASAAPPVTDAAAAGAALQRISIPADVRARISEYVWPGSSIIISDEELHKETAKATDFIVVMNDEPQGALTIRKRQPPPSYYRDYYDDGYYYYSDRSYRDYRRRPVPRYKGPFGLW
jgi:hypothetical protein